MVTSVSTRSAVRAFLITSLWLAALILLGNLSGTAFYLLPYAGFIELHFTAISVILGLLIFFIVYGRWQPLKALASMFNRGTEVERGRLVINVGLSLVVILVVVALITSLYQAMAGAPESAGSLWRDPQIIAVAIGLILSVLFVDRWRSLEGKVDAIASDQSSRLKDIQQFSHDHIELKVGQVVDKAEKVSAKLASISEQHPWLEVVTDRDIILETESVRGILRSAYNLLNEDKTLHLFEYLDFCSRKGTDLDTRDKKRPLRGTADDFLEIASFCEIWLGDYALATEFLRRFIDQAGAAGYTLYPDFMRRLLRAGDLPGARVQMARLERIVRRDQLQKLIPWLELPQPISGRYRWYACNVLAIGHAAIGREHLAERYAAEAREGGYAQRFATEQLLLDAELLIYQQRFEDAAALLDDEAAESDSAFSTLVTRIVLFERVGSFQRAAGLRARIEAARATARGDDWTAAAAGDGPRGGANRSGAKKATGSSKRKAKGKADDKAPGRGQPGDARSEAAGKAGGAEEAEKPDAKQPEEEGPARS